MEAPVRSLDEIDPDGSLRAEFTKFQTWLRENPDHVPEAIKPEDPGLCPVSIKFDEDGNSIEYCSIPGFARFLDADDVTLPHRLDLKRQSLSAWLERKGFPKLPYTRIFRKNLKLEMTIAERAAAEVIPDPVETHAPHAEVSEEISVTEQLFGEWVPAASEESATGSPRKRARSSRSRKQELEHADTLF